MIYPGTKNEVINTLLFQRRPPITGGRGEMYKLEYIQNEPQVCSKWNTLYTHSCRAWLKCSQKQHPRIRIVPVNRRRGRGDGSS